MINKETKIVLTFPGQEKGIDAPSPERTLLQQILEPYNNLKLRLGSIKDTVVYGNSFGFFAALVATGALSYEEASELGVKRGNIVRSTEDRFERMEAVVAKRGEDTTFEGRTGMLRFIGIDEGIRSKFIQDFRLNIANDYGPVVVVSGFLNALHKVAQQMDSPKRASILEIKAAYHDPIRSEDSQKFSRLVIKAPIKSARWPILTSTNPRFVEHPDDIREELVGMMVRPVVFSKVLEVLRTEGISISFDFDRIKSFTKLASKIEDVNQWLQLMTNEEDRDRLLQHVFGVKNLAAQP